jgi:hypothetical protein
MGGMEEGGRGGWWWFGRAMTLELQQAVTRGTGSRWLALQWNSPECCLQSDPRVSRHFFKKTLASSPRCWQQAER